MGGSPLGPYAKNKRAMGQLRGQVVLPAGCRTICGQDRQESNKVKPAMVWVQGNIWDLVTASGRSNAPGNLEFSQGKIRALQIVSEK